MDPETQPVNFIKSWISEHPRLVIGLLLVACLGPFLDKPIHVDDAIFVGAAEWIQQHPADFYGSEINMYGSTVRMWECNFNPPLMSYLLAGVASLFGWHEIVLHLAGLMIALAAVMGIYSLARLWCGQPLLATLIAMFTPAFLVSGTTLMCDVLMLALWVWALVFWERALNDAQARWQFIGAGTLVGLAVLTKYSALLLFPILLPILSILRTRKLLGWWWLGLVVPLLMAAGYDWITAKMYGRGLLFASAGSVRVRGIDLPGGWKAVGIITLTFAGGSLLPLMCFAPWLWRRWMRWAMGVAFFGISLGLVQFGGRLGLVHSWENLPLTRWDFLLQIGACSAAGMLLLLLVGAELWRRRDIISLVLILWIVSELYIWTVLNHSMSVRRFLPIVPAVAILLVRRLEAVRENASASGWLLCPLVLSAAVALNIAVADYQLADSVRTAARQFAAKYQPTDHNLWFPGGYGTFQYYMEKAGARRIDLGQSVLEPGDVVVMPWLNNAFVELPLGGVGWLDILRSRPGFWINPYGLTEHTAAGFYGADLGPVPFAIGKYPGQEYFVVKVFFPIQFKSRSADAGAGQAGGRQKPDDYFCSYVPEPMFREQPESTGLVRLAARSEAEGKLAEAIQYYRQALEVDSNNPAILNNLAWTLTTAGNPELRNGEEAVQLAARAVELTDCRYPVFVGTLAAAYAETGQFPEATHTACIAEALALITGQKDVYAANARLLTRYFAGQKATDAPGP
jgi:4-amino-4-deoxy-L-arabinose transferase-like glycosyltransferase